MYPRCTFDSSIFYSLAPLDRKMAGKVLRGRVDFTISGTVCLIVEKSRIAKMPESDVERFLYGNDYPQ